MITSYTSACSCGKPSIRSNNAFLVIIWTCIQVLSHRLNMLSETRRPLCGRCLWGRRQIGHIHKPKHSWSDVRSVFSLVATVHWPFRLGFTECSLGRLAGASQIRGPPVRHPLFLHLSHESGPGRGGNYRVSAGLPSRPQVGPGCHGASLPPTLSLGPVSACNPAPCRGPRDTRLWHSLNRRLSGHTVAKS